MVVFLNEWRVYLCRSIKKHVFTGNNDSEKRMENSSINLLLIARTSD